MNKTIFTLLFVLLSLYSHAQQGVQLKQIEQAPDGTGWMIITVDSGDVNHRGQTLPMYGIQIYSKLDTTLCVDEFYIDGDSICLSLCLNDSVFCLDNVIGSATNGIDTFFHKTDSICLVLINGDTLCVRDETSGSTTNLIDTLIHHNDSVCLVLLSGDTLCVIDNNSGGADLNFYKDNLTAPTHRTHNQAGYGVTINNVGVWHLNTSADPDDGFHIWADEEALWQTSTGTTEGALYLNSNTQKAWLGVGTGGFGQVTDGSGFDFDYATPGSRMFLHSTGILDVGVGLYPNRVEFKQNGGVTYGVGNYQFVDIPDTVNAWIGIGVLDVNGFLRLANYERLIDTLTDHGLSDSIDVPPVFFDVLNGGNGSLFDTIIYDTDTFPVIEYRYLIDAENDAETAKQVREMDWVMFAGSNEVDTWYDTSVAIDHRINIKLAKQGANQNEVLTWDDVLNQWIPADADTLGKNGIYDPTNNGLTWLSDTTLLNDTVVIDGDHASAAFRISTGVNGNPEALLFLSPDSMQIELHDGGGVYSGMHIDPVSGVTLSSDVLITSQTTHQFKAAVKDKDGQNGASGQILSTTGTQIDWIDNDLGISGFEVDTFLHLGDSIGIVLQNGDTLKVVDNGTDWYNIYTKSDTIHGNQERVVTFDTSALVLKSFDGHDYTYLKWRGGAYSDPNPLPVSPDIYSIDYNLGLRGAYGGEYPRFELHRYEYGGFTDLLLQRFSASGLEHLRDSEGSLGVNGDVLSVASDGTVDWQQADVVSGVNDHKTGDIIYVTKYGVLADTVFGNEHRSWPLPVYPAGQLQSCDLLRGYAGTWTWGAGGDIAYDYADTLDHVLNKVGIERFYFEHGTKHVLNQISPNIWYTYISDGISEDGLTLPWHYPADIDYVNEGEIINNTTQGYIFSVGDTTSRMRVRLNKYTDNVTGSQRLFNITGGAEFTDVEVREMYAQTRHGWRFRAKQGTHRAKFGNVVYDSDQSSPTGFFNIAFANSAAQGNVDTVDIDMSVDNFLHTGVGSAMFNMSTTQFGNDTIRNANVRLRAGNYRSDFISLPTQTIGNSCTYSAIVRLGTSTENTAEHYIDSDIFIEIDNVEAQQMVINLCEVDLVRSTIHIKINNARSVNGAMIRLNDPALFDHSRIIIEGNFISDSIEVVAWRDGSNDEPSRALIDSTSMIIFRGRYERTTGGSPIRLQDGFTGLQNIGGGRILFEDATIIAHDGTSPSIVIDDTNTELIRLRNVTANTPIDAGITVLGEPLKIDRTLTNISQRDSNLLGEFVAEEFAFFALDSVYRYGDGTGYAIPPTDNAPDFILSMDSTGNTFKTHPDSVAFWYLEADQADTIVTGDRVVMLGDTTIDVTMMKGESTDTIILKADTTILATQYDLSLVSGGVSGLTPDKVLFGKADGTIEQDVDLSFTDSTFTILTSAYGEGNVGLHLRRNHSGTAATVPITSMLIENTTETAGTGDYSNQTYLRFKAGSTQDHNRYLGFQHYTGTDDHIFGVNEGGVMISYDSDNGQHREWWEPNGATKLYSDGTGAFYVNQWGAATEASGTGGFIVGDGGSSLSTLFQAGVTDHDLEIMKSDGSTVWSWFDESANTLQVFDGGITLNNSGSASNSFLNFIRDDTNFGYSLYYNGSGQLRWSFGTDSGADPAIRFARYSGAGAFQDIPLTISNSNGQLNLGSYPINGTPVQPFALDGSKNLVNSTWQIVADSIDGYIAGAPVKLNNILAADGTNTINNLNNKQEWQWNTLTNTGLKLSTTSTAAAGNLQRVLEIALSGANATTQQTYGLHITNTHTGTGSSNYGIYATASGATNNYGVSAYGSLFGIYGVGKNAVYGGTDASGGYGIWGNSAFATSVPGYFERTQSGAGVKSAILLANSATTPTNGDGTSIQYQTKTSTTLRQSGEESFAWENVTDASRSSKYVLQTVDNTVLGTKFEVSSTGRIRFNKYGVGSFVSGTPKYVYVNDASGYLMEMTFNVLADSVDNYLAGMSDTWAKIQLTGGGNLNDAAPTLDFDGFYYSLTESPANDFDISINQEGFADQFLGNFIAGGTQTGGITVTYDDANNHIDYSITGGSSPWTEVSNDVYLNTPSNQVAIGTTTPQTAAELTVHSSASGEDAEVAIRTNDIGSGDHASVDFYEGTEMVGQIIGTDETGITSDVDARLRIEANGDEAMTIDGSNSWANGTAKVRFGGAIQVDWVNVSANTTLDKSYYGVRVTSSGVTITLPQASDVPNWQGLTYWIFNDSSGTIQIDPGGSDDFLNATSGSSTVPLGVKESILVSLAFTSAGAQQWTYVD